jgi:hypothetical protein
MNNQTEVLECGHPPSPHSEHTTGYGVDDQGNRKCYACCAEDDKQYMRDHDRMTLYLVQRDPGKWVLTNWPGSFEIPVHGVTKGRHNLARTRYDCWVTFEGRTWHFTQYGDNTQIAHGRRIKK